MIIDGMWHSEVTVHRKSAGSWLFVWDDHHNGHIHKTRYGTIYKVFFDYNDGHIWVGRLDEKDNCWFTVGNMIGATEIETFYNIITFKF